jgi:hypothetical protein
MAATELLSSKRQRDEQQFGGRLDVSSEMMAMEHSTV